MEIIAHKADTRGFADHGWLKSYHTFSFANYYNPERIRFGTMRVLNDDVIDGSSGFGTHPHDNMEIISIPVYGALEHKDSMDNIHVVHENEIQVMSAGSGVYHSEYNHSKTDKANFLQVWIFPKVRDIQPRYSQMAFDENDLKNRLKVLVSPEESKNSLWINQDAYISMGNFEEGKKVTYNINRNGNGVYIFIIEGKLGLNDEVYERRDAIGITGADKIELDFPEDTRLVLFEVPMN